MCMYRTPKTHELILKGVPDIFRGEAWILFSGAINEVKPLAAFTISAPYIPTIYYIACFTL